MNENMNKNMNENINENNNDAEKGLAEKELKETSSETCSGASCASYNACASNVASNVDAKEQSESKENVESKEPTLTLEERRAKEREQKKQERREKREKRLKEKEEKALVIPDMCWYAVHTYSGYEQKAKESLEERFKLRGLDDYLGTIKIPAETVTEVVKGQKKKRTKKFFPGYILVQMRLNQDTWHLVKGTPKVSGFVGDATDPAPLKEEDVELIKTQVEEGGMSSRSKFDFEKGESVKVIDGPFNEFTGVVEEVRPDKGKLVVSISIFGRPSPVELDYIQVEKC